MIRPRLSAAGGDLRCDSLNLYVIWGNCLIFQGVVHRLVHAGAFGIAFQQSTGMSRSMNSGKTAATVPAFHCPANPVAVDGGALDGPIMKRRSGFAGRPTPTHHRGTAAHVAKVGGIGGRSPEAPEAGTA